MASLQLKQGPPFKITSLIQVYFEGGNVHLDGQVVMLFKDQSRG